MPDEPTPTHQPASLHDSIRARPVFWFWWALWVGFGSGWTLGLIWGVSNYG